VVDPNLLKSDSLEFYRKPTLMPEFYRYEVGPIQGWPSRDTPEAMRKSLDGAHDRVRQLVRVNDQLRRDQYQLIKMVKIEQNWRKGIFWAMLVGIFIMLLDMMLH